jgi:hypothetical protein
VSLYGRRRQAAPKDELPAWIRDYLVAGEWPEEDTEEHGKLFEALFREHVAGPVLADAWARHGEALIALAAREAAGTRPHYFWHHVALREGYAAQRGEKPAALLRRHGLLLPGEEDRIPAVDFEPYTEDEIEAELREKYGLHYIPPSERKRA